MQGHPDMKRTPGIDISTGSLGQGVSCAVGMALGLRRQGSRVRVFCLAGDGECNEGQVWEAVETAVKYRLSNFILFVDQNGLQNDGPCEEIMPPQSLAEKFRSFGCRTYEIDGHAMEEILAVLDAAQDSDVPVAVVAHTVKGKGVSFMEHAVKWHGTAPNEEEFRLAMTELERGAVR